MSLNLFDNVFSCVVEVARAKGYNVYVIKFIIGGFMKKIISSVLLLTVIISGGMSFNADTIDKQVREPQGSTSYRWVKVSNSSKTEGTSYSTCASNNSNKNIACSISRTRSNSVSGNAGVCATSSCLANAGISRTNTNSYTVSGSTNWTPGKKGGKIQYSIKDKKVTTKYRKQKKTCTNYGQKCSSWTNTNSYKNVVSKGNYSVAFRYVNN